MSNEQVVTAMAADRRASRVRERDPPKSGSHVPAPPRSGRLSAAPLGDLGHHTAVTGEKVQVYLEPMICAGGPPACRVVNPFQYVGGMSVFCGGVRVRSVGVFIRMM